MSAAEFGEWQAMFRAEELHPAVDRQRHAQALAATYTGAAQRRDRRAWSAGDFLSADPWAEPARPATRAEISAQIRAMNAGRRRMH